MKYIFRLLMLALVMQSFQCDNDNSQGITQNSLNLKKQQIIEYISQFSCAEASNCNYIAFGAKPCGGPREYMVFPNKVNINTLQTLVDEYYQMDNAHNIQTGAVSDCLLVGPPTNIGCVNNVCTIIN
jgi:hypothetical protein